MEYKDYKNAGFAIRFLANLEEVFLSGILYFGLLYIFTLGISQDNLAEKAVSIATFVLVFLFLSIPICALYYTLTTNKFGGNLGKLIFNLRVVDENSGQHLSKNTAFYRYVLGYIFSMKFFGLGFIQIIRKEDKRAWHDDLFQTKVIKIKDSWVGYPVFILSASLMALFIYLIIANILQIS